MVGSMAIFDNIGAQVASKLSSHGDSQVCMDLIGPVNLLVGQRLAAVFKTVWRD